MRKEIIKLKQFIKRENLLHMIRITKINSELGQFPMRLCFCVESTQKKKYKAGKLIISKDGSPGIQIDEEIKASKFMMEKNSALSDQY